MDILSHFKMVTYNLLISTVWNPSAAAVGMLTRIRRGEPTLLADVRQLGVTGRPRGASLSPVVTVTCLQPVALGLVPGLLQVG